MNNGDQPRSSTAPRLARSPAHSDRKREKGVGANPAPAAFLTWKVLCLAVCTGSPDAKVIDMTADERG